MTFFIIFGGAAETVDFPDRGHAAETETLKLTPKKAVFWGFCVLF